MKIAILPLLMLLLAPSLATAGDASYVIRLKNGGRLLTPHHWEEGHYLKFYVVGGIMGVEKQSVRTIEPFMADLDAAPPVKKPAKPAAVSPTETQPPASTVPQMDAKEATKKDRSLLSEYHALEKKYATRASMSIAELGYLKNDLTLLREKMGSDRVRDGFTEEVNSIADMRFFVNDLILIKSRNR